MTNTDPWDYDAIEDERVWQEHLDDMNDEWWEGEYE